MIHSHTHTHMHVYIRSYRLETIMKFFSFLNLFLYVFLLIYLIIYTISHLSSLLILFMHGNEVTITSKVITIGITRKPRIVGLQPE